MLGYWYPDNIKQQYEALNFILLVGVAMVSGGKSY